MLNNITWQSYWIALAFTTTCYYSFVFLRFYRKEWLQKMRRGQRPPSIADPADQNPQLHLFQQPTAANAPAKEEPEYLPAVRSLVDEVHAFFDVADTRTNTRQSLLALLKQIVQKYPTVKETAYQHAVNNLIVFLAEQNRSLHLNREEVGSLWV